MLMQMIQEHFTGSLQPPAKADELMLDPADRLFAHFYSGGVPCRFFILARVQYIIRRVVAADSAAEL
jgi:hypothetical protein